MAKSASDSASGEGLFGRSDSSGDLQDTAAHSVRPGGRPPFTERSGTKPRPVMFVLSVLGSAVAVAAVGCFCALLYPILKDLRAERVRGEDGTEQRMLGFWSISVLSLSAGYICCVFWWILTYLDSYQPGTAFPTPLTLAHVRDSSGHGFYLGYGMAVLNGIMATLTVIWSLT